MLREQRGVGTALRIWLLDLPWHQQGEQETASPYRVFFFFFFSSLPSSALPSPLPSSPLPLFSSPPGPTSPYLFSRVIQDSKLGLWPVTQPGFGHRPGGCPPAAPGVSRSMAVGLQEAELHPRLWLKGLRSHPPLWSLGAERLGLRGVCSAGKGGLIWGSLHS